MDRSLEVLVEQAKQGDKEALESLVLTVQDRVYGLAIRMLSHPADAEDATQEILIKIVTHLGTFRGESAFTTWVYRVASNHLLTIHKRRAERLAITFELCERQVDEGLVAEASHTHPDAEEGLMVEDLMIGCMHALLLCLDRNLRITYMLGEVFKVTSDQGAYILDISAAAFRKRLSRARALLRDFMRRKCGLVNPANRCRCAKQVSYSIDTKWINPKKLLFASHPRGNQQVGLTQDQLDQLDELDRVAALFRSLPAYSAPDSIMAGLKKAINSKREAHVNANPAP